MSVEIVDSVYIIISYIFYILTYQQYQFDIDDLIYSH